MAYEEAIKDAEESSKKLSSNKSVFNFIINGQAVLVPKSSIDYIEFGTREVES